MAEIISYPEKSMLSENDYLLISDSQNSYITKKTKVSDINAIAPAAVKYWYLGSGSGSTTGLISNPDGSSQNIASGEYSVATNYNNEASGKWSFAAGQNNTASGEASATFGINNTASGDWSMAIGRGTVASGDRAFAQGVLSEARNSYSVALNFDTLAAGFMSTATGYSTDAYGQNSASFGFTTKTYGTNSVVMGDNTIAYDYGSLVIGRLNLSGSTVTADRYNFNVANTAFVIGNGTGINTRSDAFKVMFNGNTTVGNNLTLSSYGSGTKTGTATQKLAVDANGNVIELPIGSGPVDGSGTANYTARWIDTDTLGIGALYDNGTSVGIGTTSPSNKLHVAGGDARFDDNLIFTSTGYINNNASNLQLQTVGNRDIVLSPDGTGNVGIGTTSPSQKLEVNGNIQATGTRSISSLFDANHYIRLESNSSGGILKGTDGGVVTTLVRTYGDSYFNAGNVGIGTTSPEGITSGITSLSISDTGAKTTGDKNGVLAFKTDDTSYTNTYPDGVTAEIHSISESGTGAAYGLGFVTGTTTSSNRAERMRIDSSGNVGIGTDNPGFPLEVQGTSTVTIAYQRTGVSAKKWGFHSDNSNTYWHNITDNVLALTVSNAGNVGIGTTSPTRPLHVNAGSLNFVAEFQSTDDKASILIQDDDTLNYIHSQDGYLSLGGQALLSASNLNIRSSDGNVGIGTTSPQAKLDISSTGTGDSMIIRNDDASSSAAPVLVLLRDSASAANGDYLGQIKFKGNSDTGAERVYAKVTAKISDATNAAEDSLIETAVRSNGANLIVSRQTNTDLKLINGTGLESDGDIYMPVIGKGPIIRSPDGTRYRIIVDNSGNLSTETA